MHSTSAIILASLLVALYTVQISDAKKCPSVKISEGEIQGIDKESRNDRDFCSYRGIPYAKPPVGELRFEPPQPPSNWTGVKKLDDYASNCVQFSAGKKEVIGKEDCLYINVFTPLIKKEFSTKLLPVMVYIHGGYFMEGSADAARPHYFIDEDVVIVTLNYRLGVFGFLNTEDGLVRGNMGMKDQVMALKWVQRNIKAFAGDNSKVTIFGVSAGASAVHYHMLSPMSNGLFYKAISQSGTAIKIWSFQTQPRRTAEHLIKHLNCDTLLNATITSAWQERTGNWTNMLDCLKRVKASDIGKLYSGVTSPLKNKLLMLAPSVEVTQQADNDTFLAEHPFSIMISGRQQRIPWITGFNGEEGLMVTSVINHQADLLSLVESYWDNYAPGFLQYNPHRTDITLRIRHFYLTSKPTPAGITVSAVANGSCPAGVGCAPEIQIQTQSPPPIPHAHINFQDKFVEFTNIFTDRLYAHAAYKTILLQSQYSPVYAYYNTYRGEYSFANALEKKSGDSGTLKKAANWFKSSVLGKTVKEPEHMGTSHGDDFLLLFKHPDAKIKEANKDYRMSCDLVKLWVKFAKNEQPLKFGNATWVPVEGRPAGNGMRGDTFDVLQFANTGNGTGIFPLPILERMSFWESLEYLPPYHE